MMSSVSSALPLTTERLPAAEVSEGMTVASMLSGCQMLRIHRKLSGTNCAPSATDCTISTVCSPAMWRITANIANRMGIWMSMGRQPPMGLTFSFL